MSRRFRWTPEKIALLGTMADQTLANQLGLTVAQVFFKRKTLGIAASQVREGWLKWTPEVIAQLGSASDAEIGARLGIHQGAIASARQRFGIDAFEAQRRWTPEEVALLGTMTDAEVAKKLNRGKAAVRWARQQRKIPGIPCNPGIGDEWAELEREYSTSDVSVVALAEKYGVCCTSVLKRAKRLGWMRPSLVTTA